MSHYLIGLLNSPLAMALPATHSLIIAGLALTVVVVCAPTAHCTQAALKALHVLPGGPPPPRD